MEQLVKGGIHSGSHNRLGRASYLRKQIRIDSCEIGPPSLCTVRRLLTRAREILRVRGTHTKG